MSDYEPKWRKIMREIRAGNCIHHIDGVENHTAGCPEADDTEWLPGATKTEMDKPIITVNDGSTRRPRTCVECGESILGDVMIPEGTGPMHTACWVDWVKNE